MLYRHSHNYTWKDKHNGISLCNCLREPLYNANIWGQNELTLLAYTVIAIIFHSIWLLCSRTYILIQIAIPWYTLYEFSYFIALFFLSSNCLDSSNKTVCVWAIGWIAQAFLINYTTLFKTCLKIIPIIQLLKWCHILMKESQSSIYSAISTPPFEGCVKQLHYVHFAK